MKISCKCFSVMLITNLDLIFLLLWFSFVVVVVVVVVVFVLFCFCLFCFLFFVARKLLRNWDRIFFFPIYDENITRTGKMHWDKVMYLHNMYRSLSSCFQCLLYFKRNLWLCGKKMNTYYFHSYIYICISIPFHYISKE